MMKELTRKLAQRWISKKGMTLADLVIAMGMAGIVSVAIYALITQTQEKAGNGLLINTLSEKAIEIKSTLSNRRAILNTISSALNPNMACLLETDRTKPCSQSYVATNFSILQDRIAIINGGPSPGQLFYDGRVGNSVGYTEKGTQCAGFSVDGEGNDLCPIGYLFTWYIGSAGTFSGVKLTITAKMIFNPSNKNSMKRKLNATLNSPLGKYDVEVSHSLESLVDLGKIVCVQDGVVLPIKSTLQFYSTLSAPFGSTCNPSERTCNEISGIPILSGTGSYATCIQDCKGHWSPCSAPCNGGTQNFFIDTPANAWGRACPYLAGTTQICNTHACGNSLQINCVGGWSTCSGGFRTYHISVFANETGTDCPYFNGTTEACGVNCVGQWGICADGIQTYTHLTSASGGGRACVIANGATQSCGVSCQGAWSDCVKHRQNYSISRKASGGGAVCPYIDGAIRTCVSCTWASNEGFSHENYVFQILRKFSVPEAKACVSNCSGVANCNPAVCCTQSASACSTAGATTTCRQYDSCTDSCSGALRTLTCTCS